MSIEGGCFCGKIRYAIREGDYRVVNCHCSMCRRTSAAPFVTWLIVPKTAFEFTKGSPRTLKSSEKGTRRFCAECGTPLTFNDRDRPEQVDVTTGSLDDPDRFRPTSAVFEENKLTWLQATE